MLGELLEAEATSSDPGALILVCSKHSTAPGQPRYATLLHVLQLLLLRSSGQHLAGVACALVEAGHSYPVVAVCCCN